MSASQGLPVVVVAGPAAPPRLEESRAWRVVRVGRHSEAGAARAATDAAAVVLVGRSFARGRGAGNGRGGGQGTEVAHEDEWGDKGGGGGGQGAGDDGGDRHGSAGRRADTDGGGGRRGEMDGGGDRRGAGDAGGEGGGAGDSGNRRGAGDAGGDGRGSGAGHILREEGGAKQEEAPECGAGSDSGGRPALTVEQAAQQLRAASRTVFIAVLAHGAAEDGRFRLRLFDAGCNMVSADEDAVHRCVGKAAAHRVVGGRLSCPTCGMQRLTEDALHEHHPLQHIYAKNHPARCPVCGKRVRNFAVHLHDRHGPVGRGETHEQVGRPHIALYAFALVVVRRPSDGRFLLVQEFAGQGFWLPGGGVDAMEGLVAGGVRETLEEAGVAVTPKGVVKLEYTPRGDRRTGEAWVKLRAILYAEPARDEQLPKSEPDFESAGAVWASWEDIQAFHKAGQLRGWEPVAFCGHVHNRHAVAPLSVLDDGFGR